MNWLNSINGKEIGTLYLIFSGLKLNKSLWLAYLLVGLNVIGTSLSLNNKGVIINTLIFNNTIIYYLFIIPGLSIITLYLLFTLLLVFAKLNDILLVFKLKNRISNLNLSSPTLIIFCVIQIIILILSMRLIYFTWDIITICIEPLTLICIIALIILLNTNTISWYYYINKERKLNLIKMNKNLDASFSLPHIFLFFLFFLLFLMIVSFYFGLLFKFALWMGVLVKPITFNMLPESLILKQTDLYQYSLKGVKGLERLNHSSFISSSDSIDTQIKDYLKNYTKSEATIVKEIEGINKKLKSLSISSEPKGFIKKTNFFLQKLYSLNGKLFTKTYINSGYKSNLWNYYDEISNILKETSLTHEMLNSEFRLINKIKLDDIPYLLYYDADEGNSVDFFKFRLDCSIKDIISHSTQSPSIISHFNSKTESLPYTLNWSDSGLVFTYSTVKNGIEHTLLFKHLFLALEDFKSSDNIFSYLNYKDFCLFEKEGQAILSRISLPEFTLSNFPNSFSYAQTDYTPQLGLNLIESDILVNPIDLSLNRLYPNGVVLSIVLDKDLIKDLGFLAYFCKIFLPTINSINLPFNIIEENICGFQASDSFKRVLDNQVLNIFLADLIPANVFNSSFPEMVCSLAKAMEEGLPQEYVLDFLKIKLDNFPLNNLFEDRKETTLLAYLQKQEAFVIGRDLFFFVPSSDNETLIESNFLQIPLKVENQILDQWEDILDKLLKERANAVKDLKGKTKEQDLPVKLAVITPEVYKIIKQSIITHIRDNSSSLSKSEIDRLVKFSISKLTGFKLLK